MEAEAKARRVGRRARRRDAGFTLIEIMVVVAIISLIIGSVGVVAFNAFQRAQVKTTKTRINEIQSATTQYMLDNNGSCPGGIEALISGKYLKKGGIKDAWGKDFVFRCPGTQDTDGADISSAGRDKQEGTADDIKSWEQ